MGVVGHRQQIERPRAERKDGAYDPARQERLRLRGKRTVAAGTLSFTGHSATNKIVFQGRISRSHELAPGHYRLLITATNAAGVPSAPTSLSFTIVS
jgi:hypothetical protein